MSAIYISSLLCQRLPNASIALALDLGLLGLLGVEGFLSALPFGLAVGGVRTSEGGTGPSFAKYKFLLRMNFTCTAKQRTL